MGSQKFPPPPGGEKDNKPCSPYPTLCGRNIIVIIEFDAETNNVI